jgi:bla regulator protein blaR1
MLPTPDALMELGRQAGNHLWQSTAVAMAAALAALAVRGGRARARYWLWLAASVKFLVPFAVLGALGGGLGAWLRPAAEPARAPLLIRQAAEPFAVTDDPLPLAAAPAPQAAPAASPLPAALLAVWIGGILVVGGVWFARWRRMAALVRAARPLTTGCEAEALARIGGAGLPLVASQASLEPGVFGVFHPVLWVPEGLGSRLTEAELDAILTHELCHARRRDNLAAAMHAAVEAVFWFHPLVWWLGARLTEERERACDESVVGLGGDPRAYAEGILKVCEFYLASPACAAGVTGGELKRRIESIAGGAFARELSRGAKALFAGAAAVAVAAPIVIGLMSAPGGRAAAQPAGGPAAQQQEAAPPASAVPGPPAEPRPPREEPRPTRFDAASVKVAPPLSGGVTVVRKLFGGPGTQNPGLVAGDRCTLTEMLVMAYGLETYQFARSAALEENFFTLEARVPHNAIASDIRVMMQTLLAERFGLRAHWEKRNQPGYELTAAKGGVKLTPSSGPKPPEDKTPPHFTFTKGLGLAILPPGYPADGIFTYSNGGVLHTTGAARVTIAQLAKEAAHYLHQPVNDKTGLKGKFDFNFTWRSGEPQFRLGMDPPDEPLPPLFPDAIRQLGLIAQPAKIPVEFLVVDHVESVPTEN